MHLTVLFSQKQAYFPVWILDSKFYNSNEYSIGISDPDLDSTKAFEQAKLRAIVNYSIFNNSQYGSLTSVIIGNEQEVSNSATTIETILYTSIIKGNTDYADLFQVEKKEFTTNNECCILLKKQTHNNLNINHLSYNIIKRCGFQKENKLFPVFIDELEVSALLNDSIEMIYLIKRKANRYIIKSEFGYKNDLKETRFKDIYRNYTSTQNPDMEINTAYYSPISSGLWAAYIFELSDQISFNSILSKNMANQLITLEQGNIAKNNKTGTLNNLIFSSRKIETEALKLSIKNMQIRANFLKINTEQMAISQTNTKRVLNVDNFKNFRLRKLHRKERKKLIKEKWTAINHSDITSAYSELKTFENNDEYLSSSATFETRNLGNGMLKGLQLARTEIENQLKSKINALNNSEVENGGNLIVKTSKTHIKEKTGRIEPYFVFYRKISQNYYQLKVIVFYKI